MLEKITTFLVGLLFFQLALYGHTAFDSINEQTSYYSENATTEHEEEDAAALIAKLGIRTEVDEEALNEKYPEAKVITNPQGGKATLTFTNPEESNYRLDVYDTEKGLVASYVNISSDKVVFEKGLYSVGAYIYKLVGKSGTFSGTFVIE